jgi:hypothetical protein
LVDLCVHPQRPAASAASSLLLFAASLQIQRMNKTMLVPRTLANTHMPELAQLECGSTIPLELQLVLLPPEASDITPGGLLYGIVT